MPKIEGSILSAKGWIKGQLEFEDTILHINGEETSKPEAPYIIPGFVDLHNHGGGGSDVMSGQNGIAVAAKLHACHGTTSMLATSVTAPQNDIESFLESVANYMVSPPKGTARILGAHLEGPFINPNKLGAQPPFALAAHAEVFRNWAAIAPIIVITYAPECDPDGALLDAIHAANTKAQIGHSLCDYALAQQKIKAGCGVTHLFNAMTGIAHRGNGIAGAALAHADYAEIIPDLVHVEAGAILAARRAIPNLYGVTDATAAAGMPDGDYALGQLVATKCDGIMRLPDGTLAGSSLTMDEALRNFVSIGLPLDEASRRLSQIPADWIGRSDIGRIEPEALADFVILDSDLSIQDVWISGHSIMSKEEH